MAFKIKQYKKIDAEKIKQLLFDRLVALSAFWSYDKTALHSLSDWNLIKYTLIHLDLDSINLLFRIFLKKEIKRVWLQKLVTQGTYLMNMNVCIANLYFDIKEPVSYLKRMETYQIGRKWISTWNIRKL
jgi:hypothetical protein